MSMLAGGLLVALAGCDAAEESAGLADRMLIGEVDDDTFVAVITDAESVLAYVCDGTPTSASRAMWFVGTHDGASFSLSHKSGARLDGSLVGDQVRGELRLEAGALEYGVASAEGDAGLFLADEGDLRGGWIVQVDGDQRGAVLHRTTGDIVAAQPIMPSQASVVMQEQASPLLRLQTPSLPK